MSQNQNTRPFPTEQEVIINFSATRRAILDPASYDFIVPFLREGLPDGFGFVPPLWNPLTAIHGPQQPQKRLSPSDRSEKSGRPYSNSKERALRHSGSSLMLAWASRLETCERPK